MESLSRPSVPATSRVFPRCVPGARPAVSGVGFGVGNMAAAKGFFFSPEWADGELRLGVAFPREQASSGGPWGTDTRGNWVEG